MAHTTRRVPHAIAALMITVGAAVGLVTLQPIAAHAGETDTIYSLVNDERFSQGSSGLVRNAGMDAVAASWATALAQAGTLSHNPNYSSQIPGGWVAAAENVAQGYGSGAAMHAGWMNSAGHRANILGDFTDIGIAYLEAGGTTWGVEVFANYPGTVTPTASAAAPPPAPAPAPAEPIAEAPAPDAQTPAITEGPTEGSAQAPAGTPTQAGLPTSPPAPTVQPGEHSRVPTDTAGGNDARDATAAATLENAGPAGTATDQASSLSDSAPLLAALVAAALVGAVGIRSYRLRDRAARQARHSL